MKLLVSLLGCLCLCNAAVVRADPAPPAKPTQTTKKKTFLTKFIITNPVGDSQQGSTGEYLPSAADVSPANKDYYVNITASITVPMGTEVPDTLSILARRVRLPVAAAGETKKVLMNQKLDLPDIRKSPDSTTIEGKTIYRYATYEPSKLSSQTADEAARMANAWKVTREKGRWRLSIKPGTGASNLVYFKIDKRGQIANAALAWASFWPNRPESSKRYGTVGDGQGGTERILTERVYLSPTGQELFTQCHSFAGYIYNRHGLYAAYSGDIVCNGLQAAATADDDGVGSLRCFAAHTGITTGRGALYGGQMVDINNPEEAEGGKGIQLHSWNYPGTLSNRPNRTMPAPGAANDPATGRPKSWLKALDEE